MTEVQSRAIAKTLCVIGADATSVLLAIEAWTVEVLSRDRRTVAIVSEGCIAAFRRGGCG